MILGLGIDSTSIERCLNKEEHFVRKYFHSDEYKTWSTLSGSEIKAQFLSSRFAVKEAYAKARGTGFCENVVPSEINTVSGSNGKPEIQLCGRTLQTHPQNTKIHVSITHEKPLSTAIVIIEEL